MNSKRKEDWIKELATMITTIREDQPPTREHMLEEAVFRVIRYRNLQNNLVKNITGEVDQLRGDIEAP